jgi:hypothetical protein
VLDGFDSFLGQVHGLQSGLEEEPHSKIEIFSSVPFDLLVEAAHAEKIHNSNDQQSDEFSTLTRQNGELLASDLRDLVD